MTGAVSGQTVLLPFTPAEAAAAAATCAGSDGSAGTTTTGAASGVPVPAAPMMRSRRSVRLMPLTGLGGTGGVMSGPKSKLTPTQPEIEKKNRSTSPQNSPSMRMAMSPLSSWRASRISSPRAEMETTTRSSSPRTKMPPLSSSGAVPKPISTLAEASSLIGPAAQRISKPEPKPTEKPSKEKRTSPPRLGRPPSSIIR